MVDISIIVPVYNAKRYLPNLLVSLAEQTYQGFRLFIIDDCSTDSSYEIATYLVEPLGDRAVVLRNAMNLGPGASRNVGLEEAAKRPTKYVTFLDADDWIEPAYLEDLHSTAEKHNADLTISGLIRFDDKTGDVLCKEMVSYPQELFENAADCDDLAQINTCPYAKLFRYEPIRNLRFRTAKRSEDTCYMFEALLQLKSIAFTNNAFAHYRVRSGSITGTMDWETVESMHQLFSDAYASFLTEQGLPFRELFEAQAYLRSSVGGVARAAFADMREVWRFASNELSWLDSTMPTWRNNKYLSFGKWRSRTPQQLALKMTASMYKLHVFPLFVYVYFFVARGLGKEVRA